MPIGYILVPLLLIIFLLVSKKANSTHIMGNTLPITYMQPPLHTKLLLRNDKTGLGHYHAPRGNRLHEGIDFLALPNTPVYAPCSGVTRIITVYSTDTRWKGVGISNGNNEVKLYYLTAIASLPKFINASDLIGHMQNRASITPGMLNHIHVQIDVSGKAIDPTLFFKFSK